MQTNNQSIKHRYEYVLYVHTQLTSEQVLRPAALWDGRAGRLAGWPGGLWEGWCGSGGLPQLVAGPLEGAGRLRPRLRRASAVGLWYDFLVCMDWMLFFRHFGWYHFSEFQTRRKTEIM